MRSSGGFTLIEVIATGGISTLLAAVLLTLLYTATDQTEEMVPRQRVMSAYNIVSEQIQSMARQACQVRSYSEAHTPGTPLPALGSSVSFQDGLVFYDRANLVIGGYHFQASGGSHYLEEWDPGLNNWKPFKIINDTLWLTPGNKFGHARDRKSVSFEIHLRYYMDGAYSNYKTPTETAYLKGN